MAQAPKPPAITYSSADEVPMTATYSVLLARFRVLATVLDVVANERHMLAKEIALREAQLQVKRKLGNLNPEGKEIVRKVVNAPDF